MILLDTRVIIWDLLNKQKIPDSIYKMIEIADDKGELIMSDISLWEIGMILSKQRIEIFDDHKIFMKNILVVRNYLVKSINIDIALTSNKFMQIIKSDPADSIIAATAHHLNATLITADQKIIDSNVVKTLWK